MNQILCIIEFNGISCITSLMNSVCGIKKQIVSARQRLVSTFNFYKS
jgi:hypothetical protein